MLIGHSAHSCSTSLMQEGRCRKVCLCPSGGWDWYGMHTVHASLVATSDGSIKSKP